MNVANIKHLVDANHSIEMLELAEQALLNAIALPIDVPGETAGDKLTSVMAALWVLRYREAQGCTATEALRDFTAMVRSSMAR